MYLDEVLRVLRREWLITVVGLLLTAFACVGSMQMFPPKEKIALTVLLLPPVTPGATATQPSSNPFLEIGGLSAPSEVLARTLNTTDVQGEMKTVSDSAEYQAARDYTTSAPVIVISVQDDNLEDAQKVKAALTRKVPTVLRELQAAVGVDTRSMMTSAVLADDAKPVEVRTTTLRAAVAVGAVGIVVTVFAATVRHVLRRRGRRAARRRGSQVLDEPSDEESVDEATERSPAETHAGEPSALR